MVCSDSCILGRCTVGQEFLGTELWLCRQRLEDPITTCGPFNHLASVMTHTVGDSAACSPSTAPVKSNLVFRNKRHALTEAEEQPDCTMVGWNTLLKFIEHQRTDSDRPIFHAASGELSDAAVQIGADADRELNAERQSCKRFSHAGPSIFEGDDLVDMASRLKVARAVALLLKLSDAAGCYRVPGTLHQGIRTKSGRSNDDVQQCKTLQRKELHVSHQAVNKLPSWQFATQKPASARVNRSGKDPHHESTAVLHLHTRSWPESFL